MATVQDLIEGSSLELSKGYKHTRAFLVTDLTGNSSAKLYNAVQATGIAQGDAHPVIANIYARAISVTPIGPTSARVSISYEPRDPATSPPDDGAAPNVEVGAVTNEVEVDKDIKGNQIILTYTFTKYNTETKLLEEIENKGQVGTVKVQRPVPVFKLSRRETQSPHRKALEFVGKMNSDTFMGEPAKYWLCTRIVGRSDDGGESYNVDYEFQFNADTWDPQVVATDPDTGKPPINYDGSQALVDGEGYKRVTVYESVAFSGLKL